MCFSYSKEVIYINLKGEDEGKQMGQGFDLSRMPCMLCKNYFPQYIFVLEAKKQPCSERLSNISIWKIQDFDTLYLTTNLCPFH